MREESKLSDGVVTLSPLGPDDPGRTPAPHPWEPWRAHGPVRILGIRAGRLVGTVELRPAAAGFARGDVDLCVSLRPEARGRGLATRAVLLACDHARAAGARRAVVLAPAETPGADTAAGAGAGAGAGAVARRAGFARRGQISRADGALLDWHVKELDTPEG
ncbi:GNAT family N-acetyltransferase [Streptomyces sp. SKN60]|uniref:GNAT family N-acetyltransferase n=1 Tax=Streptomyces sp. SKN60 TaxID=2855506 RepID=UPI0022460844|nr:GNAT family N-acetyltransferase [Streptomyces sp. SKN60]MCX2180719.1 GNAT family N-acetyltransferase [Streptomyces sp. SKN60]